MIMVNDPSPVTEKERKPVCTIDEYRKVPVDKVGTIHSDLWSEVRNRLSRRVYLILTQPDQGSDAWVTHIFALVEKKALFGLLTFTAMNFNRPLAAFRSRFKIHASRFNNNRIILI